MLCWSGGKSTFSSLSFWSSVDRWLCHRWVCISARSLSKKCINSSVLGRVTQMVPQATRAEQARNLVESRTVARAAAVNAESRQVLGHRTALLSARHFLAICQAVCAGRPEIREAWGARLVHSETDSCFLRSSADAANPVLHPDDDAGEWGQQHKFVENQNARRSTFDASRPAIHDSSSIPAKDVQGLEHDFGDFIAL